MYLIKNNVEFYQGGSKMSFFTFMHDSPAVDDTYSDYNQHDGFSVYDAHSGVHGFDSHGGIGDHDSHGGVEGFDAHGGIDHHHPVAFWDGNGDNHEYIDDHGMVHPIVDSHSYDDDGNFNEILNHHDPLAHSGDYHCHHFFLHNPSINPHYVHVNGYFRGDGTYVQDHLRTMPDGIEENNISFHYK